MRPHPWLVLVLAGALVGAIFAGLSTYDFAQHLDRQVHSLHCSFIPGMVHDAGGGTSGCQVAMMSPYSSVFRGAVWGGIPIALPAMMVFAFIAFFALDLVLTGRQRDRRATGFLALATALPAVASVVMAIISLTELGTTCKLCVAIYAASAACLVGALALWREATTTGPAVARAPRPAPARARSEDPVWAGGDERRAPAPVAEPPRTAVASSTSNAFLAGAFAVGVVFVAAPVALYAAAAPDHRRFVGSCDALVQTEDPYGVMVQLGRPAAGAVPAIEILDPLCPACRAFEERLEGARLATRLDRRVVLFPLDSTCNWMVEETMHAGACVVSEAVLCAGERADDVIAWAFTTQERIRDAAKKDPASTARLVAERFPELAACVGSAKVKSQLNKSLRWAVQNHVPVLTPQLYVAGVKLCDEDVDLGLEYTLGAMIERHANGTLVAKNAPAAPAAPATATAPVAATPATAPAVDPAAKPVAAKPAPTPPPAAAAEKPTPTPAPTPAPTPTPSEPATAPEPTPTPEPPPAAAPEAPPAEPATPPAEPAAEPAAPAAGTEGGTP